MERLMSVVGGLQTRFPPQNYGWKHTLLRGEARWGRTRVNLSPPPNGFSYDCASSALKVQMALRGEGFQPQVLQAFLPLRDDHEGIEHYVSTLKIGSEHIIVGLTPLDALLGLGPVRVFSESQFCRLTERLNAAPLKGREPRKLKAAKREFNFDLFFPFQFVPSETAGSANLLAEFYFSKQFFTREVGLSVQAMTANPDTPEILQLGAISFGFSFLPPLVRGFRRKPNFPQRLERRMIKDEIPIADPRIRSRMLGLAEEAYPVIARLASQLA